MTVLQKYFASEIIRSVVFVLVAFLDLKGEVQSVGRGGYRLQHAFLYVIMGLPGYAYELMPIAALIGTIYVLAQFASCFVFLIMRVSSMSTATAGMMLARIGILFVAITFLFGEFISPKASELAEKLKLSAQGATVSQEFRSGLWAKDVIRQNGASGPVIGSRFLNVRTMRPSGELEGVKIFEFDKNFRMTAIMEAERAAYRGSNVWQLTNELASRFF